MESSLSSRLRLQQLAMMQMLNDLRFVVMSAILLIDDDLDLLYAYVQSLLPRPPRKRRFQALLRPHGSIWTAMSGDTPVWASYGPEFEDEKYYEHFRMDKHGFDYIYSKIKGKG